MNCKSYVTHGVKVRKLTEIELRDELVRVQQANHEQWVKFMAEKAERDKGYETEEYECNTVVGEATNVDTVVGEATDVKPTDVEPEPDDVEQALGK